MDLSKQKGHVVILSANVIYGLNIHVTDSIINH